MSPNQLSKLYSVLTPRHQDLNPELWDTKTKKLLPEVREQLLQTLFTETQSQGLDPSSIITGVYLIGSAASYHWDSSNDLDVTVTIKND